MIFEDACYLDVVLRLIAKHIGDYGGREAGERGQLVGYERAYADVLESDGVDHPGFGLHHARRRVAFDGLARESLDYESAERVEVHQLLEFQAVAEGPGCRQHRVSKLDSAKIGFERPSRISASAHD